MMDVVACDIDGVVADPQHRLHHLQAEQPDWDAFFSGIPEDPPLPIGINLIRGLAQHYRIVWVTARPITYLESTQRWLELHFPNTPGLDAIIMRETGDFRTSSVSKLEQYRLIPDLAFVIEDNLRVIAELVKEKIPVLAVMLPEGGDVDGFIDNFSAPR